MSNLAETFTISITNASYVVPDGATEIFFENTGGANATWTGNMTKDPNGVVTTAIVLGSGKAYAYGFIGRGRKGFTVNAPATTLQISLTF